ncbi:MAG: hypothetical protein V4515_02735 [Chloroflexota bacterium]
MDLDQEPADSGAAEPSQEPGTDGLRYQFGAVRAAIRRLLTAHLDLAKAEASEIGAEIGRVALLAGVAFGAIVLLGILLPIGGLLFLADWLLGSLGWGVLLGGVALLDLAMMAVLVALGIPGGSIGRDFLVAVLGAFAVTILLLLLNVSPQLGAGLGLFVLLVGWPILAGIGVARNGIDTGALKSRFYPTQTIETTKETLEWVRERTPLGPKS